MSTARYSTIREWRPGDGVVCSRARQAPRDSPCGPPVAVYTSEAEIVRYGARPIRRPVERTFIVCAQHIPADTTPGQDAQKARKAATEALIVAHWAEHQSLIEKHADEIARERLANLPEPIRQYLA